MPYRAYASGNDGVSGTTSTCAIVVPATAQVGDLALVQLSTNSSSTTTFTAPTGWASLAGPDNASSAIQTQLFWKTLVGGDIGASRSFTCSVAGKFIGQMRVSSGNDASGIIARPVSKGTTADTSVVSPSGTTGASPATWAVVVMGVARAGSVAAPVISTAAGMDLNGTTSSGSAASPNFTMFSAQRNPQGAAATAYGPFSFPSNLSVSDETYLILIPTTVSAAPPTLAASPSLDVEPGSTVTLTAAHNSGTGAFTFAQTGGAAVTLSGADPVRTFLAPPTLAGDTLTFTATDSGGTSAAASVAVLQAVALELQGGVWKPVYMSAY